MGVRAVTGPVSRSARRRLINAARLRSESTPAPVGGWNARDALANMPVQDAVRLDNWFPEDTYVRLRKGHSAHATGLTGNVESLMSWNGSSSSKLFAAANNAVYEVTSAGAIGAAEFSGLSSIRFQHVMYNTSAGNYLYIVNGADAPRYYDGSSWTTPSITGVTTTDLIHINVFKRRLFFIENNSLSFWYLAVDSLAGAASEFDLGPLCSLGGHLVAMGTWTRDGGSGIDDFAVFMTSKGEVVIYQGTDPGDASAWSLVGVFRIGPPLGRRCLIKVGADLVASTHDGFSQMTRFLSGSRASRRAALSDKISRAVRDAVRDYNSYFGWQPVFYPEGNMVLFNIPTGTNRVADQFVSNSTTGAWCRFTGQPALCWENHDGGIYFGGSTMVWQADTGQDDDGSDIDTDLITANTYLGYRGRLKRFGMIRPNFIVDGNVDAAISVNVDFEDRHPSATPTFNAIGGSLWDVAEWDVAEWSAADLLAQDWQVVDNMGHAAAVRLKTASQNGDIKLNAIDWLYELGAFV